MAPFVFASPEDLASASRDLTSIGSALRSATAAAEPSTTWVAAAAQDEVSAAIAALFGSGTICEMSFSRLPLETLGAGADWFLWPFPAAAP